ncbi:diaminopimelate decarboxylase [Leucobacter allii]|uniref:Diaminopimelate decarboxylase n=1 Tax=Leucobacter allii TaxID=2932247 RepID=A0ABY4FRM9_9MICO|nr:diaminopimelate decarboxylase [Leucobacter allii]UOQ58928.1 diaminopimelate decarboxylase [Leucobacter allii]
MQHGKHQPDVAGTRIAELWGILPEEAGRIELGDGSGELAIGGVGVTELAERFGTPLHVVDEDGLRRQIRRFVDGLRARWPRSEVLFASKSFPAVAMYRAAHEEGLSIDVAGGGELQLALAAGVDPTRVHVHGNAKTDAELRMALDAGVGAIIVDNEDELDRLERLLERPQSLLLRVIPGVEAETHASQATGGRRSKFGLPLDQAERAIARMRAHPLMEFAGVHLHIGSQILNTRQFAEAVANISSVGEFAGYDVGGGLGVRYTYEERPPSVEEYLDAIVAAAREHLPADAKLLIEPGRSIVARAGVTLYRVVSVKRTGDVFVAVDGGLADNLDIALTDQRYEALLANRIDEPWTESVQLVGRQCESGDRFIDGAPMPAARVDDVVALAATGAYAYTLSNNYNGALKPAIVFVRDGEARLVVRRESYAELLATHAPALPSAG